MNNFPNQGKSKKARRRRNKKLRERSSNPTEELQQPSNPTEELQPSIGELQIFAISHNILRVPQGVSMLEAARSISIDPPQSNSRFDKCRYCGTNNPISRTYCYNCNEVLL